MKARIPYRMNSSAKKAMMEEINRQIVENDNQYSMDFDAAVLWTLHTVFGFGEKRLKKFLDCFSQEHQRLREHYQLSPEDDGWLYLHMLKEHTGFDLEEWYKQRGENDGKESIL